MSIASEEQLKNLIQKNKAQQLKLSQVLKYQFEQEKAKNDLDGCLNILVAAITVQQDEHKNAVNELKIGYRELIQTAKDIKTIDTEQTKIDYNIQQQIEEIKNNIKLIPKRLNTTPNKSLYDNLLIWVEATFQAAFLFGSLGGIIYLLKTLF